MTDYFLRSRSCTKISVYTSCTGIKLKLTPHYLEGTSIRGHGLPLFLLHEAMANPVTVSAQDNGRWEYLIDGYRVVVSGKDDGLYHPIVTSHGYTG